MMAWLSGKKTIIGSLLLSLLGLVYFADLIPDATATWFTDEQYIAAGAFITGLTGVAMRLGVGKGQNGAKP